MSTLKPPRSSWNPHAEMILFLFAFLVTTTSVTADAASIACPTDVGCKCRGSTVDCSNLGLVRLPASLPPGTRVLSLKRNEITELDRDAFGSMPNLVQLNLANNRLTAIPTFTANNSRLKELILSGNRIAAISASPIAPLWRLTSLNLKHNTIRELKVSAFPKNNSIASLELSRNLIEGINVRAFRHLSGLKQLRLSRNRISSWNTSAGEAFLTNLETLDLSNNWLTSVRSLMFNSFHFLNYLNLGKNRIRKVQDGAFYSPKSSLRELLLDHNMMTEISGGSVFGLESIRKLNFSHNLINTIGISVFTSLKHLKELDLSGNKIISIRRDFFVGLASLTTLLASHNEIESIDGGSFAGLTRLVSLDLSHNLIKWDIHISTAFFSGATSLYSLNLAHNHIDFIYKDCFVGLANLKTLDLRNNSIGSIQENAFASLANVTDIQLISFHFRCDCRLAWFPEWLAENEHLVRGINGRCGKGKHTGVNLLDLTRADFTCDGFPVIVRHPRSMKAILNETVNLWCEATSINGESLHFSWIKDARVVNPNETEAEIVVFPGEEETVSQLIIPKMRMKDAGNYTCIVENLRGKVKSKTAMVTGNVYPVFTVTPIDAVVEESGIFIMECQAWGIPFPEILFRIYKKDRDSTLKKLNVLKIGDNDERPKAVLENVAKEDEGIYGCIAFNDVGKIQVNFSLTVLPKSYESHLDYTIAPGKSLILKCDLNYDGARTWYREDESIISTSRRKVTEQGQWLVFDAVQLSDTGKYECRIREKDQLVVQSFKLTVELPSEPTQTVPGPPDNQGGDSMFYAWIALSLVCGVLFATALWTIVFVAFRWKKRRQSHRISRKQKSDPENGKQIPRTNGLAREENLDGGGGDGDSSGSGRLPIRIYVSSSSNGGVRSAVEPSSSGTTTSRTNGHRVSNGSMPPNGKAAGGASIPMVVVGQDGTFRAVPTKKKSGPAIAVVPIDSDSDVD